MSDQLGGQIRAVPDRPVYHFWPQTRSGWWALALTFATLLYSKIGPGSGVISNAGKYTRMTGLAILAAVAAYFLVRAIWREKERSVVIFVALALLIVTAAFWPLFVLGEWVFPH